VERKLKSAASDKPAELAELTESVESVKRLRSTPATARWWQPLPTAAAGHADVLCELCPHACTLADGAPGACHVRRNVDGRLVSTTYGRASGFRIGTVETAGLYHFHPGAAALSLATTGCTLACAYCASGDAPSAPVAGRATEAVSPEGIAQAAQAYGARLVAFCDSDPASCAEYAIDIAVACRARGLKTLAMTAGYIMPPAARELFATLDAVRLGVKAFRETTYAQLCGGRLQPVLDTLCQLRFETRCWLEIGYALVPGYNDSPSEIGELAAWIVRELGADVPLHLAPHTFKTRAGDAGRQALAQARQAAIDAGLQHVYTQQAKDSEGGTTFCAHCAAALIERDAGSVIRGELGDDARCPYCRAPVAGYFARLAEPPGACRGVARWPVRCARR
jgi:pyruvate formate lyase activating enzyme